jgi:hypothetical protein
MNATANPYAPPTAKLADDQGAEPAPPLWNPNAAANWSLLFTPAFGALLHMLNWRALGEAKKAAVARGWFIASLVMLVVYVGLGLGLSNPQLADALGRATGIGFLIVWYFAAARGQAKTVTERFGKTYPRRGWTLPLLFAVLALVGYVVLAGVAGYLYYSATPS